MRRANRSPLLITALVPGTVQQPVEVWCEPPAGGGAEPGLAAATLAEWGPAALYERLKQGRVALLEVWLLLKPEPAATQQGAMTARQRQMGELLTETEKAERASRMRDADLHIAVAVTTLGLSMVGNLFWPLKLMSLPGFFYLFGRNLNRTWRLIEQRRVGVPMIGTAINLGMLASGYLTVGSIGLLIQQLADKMLATVVDGSRAKLIDSFRQSPRRIWLILEEGEVEVDLEQVRAGQRVAVNAGETIPVDGVVVAGIATVDQHLLTGEARPVDKRSGERVFAATLVVAGRIEVAVEQAGSATTVAQIGEILNRTVDYKSAVQLRAEALGDSTVIPTFVAAAATWALLGPMAALTLMSCHFRRAMGLFGPLSMMSYLNASSQRGILIKDGRSLDLLSQVDTLVFDKTGTLTEQEPCVAAVHLDARRSVLGESAAAEERVLRLAAAAEQRQSHPIARAICAAARQRLLTLPPLQEGAYELGRGLTVQIEGQTVRVGSTRLVEGAGIEIPVWVSDLEGEVHGRGHSLVLVACDEEIVGAIELMPKLRAEVKQILERLRAEHAIQETYILSGDHSTPTRQLAELLGIDHYFAELMPEQKAQRIEQLKAEGRSICYIGDGINDAIALKRAQVSISLAGASSVAVDTAQIVLVNDSLDVLPELFRLAREFRENTNQTFGVLVGISLFGMGGALLFNFNLLHAAALSLFSLGAGTINSLRPMVKYQSEREDVLLERPQG